MDVSRYILNVLIKESSRENPLTLTEIEKKTVALLKKANYSQEEIPSKSTLRRRIIDLINFDHNKMNLILNNEKQLQPGVHCCTSKEDSVVGYWIENTLSDEELRYVFDSIMVSDILPHERVQSILERIIGVASNSFGDKVKYYTKVSKHLHTSTIDTLENVGIITDAIQRKRRVEFTLNVYKWDYNSKKGKFEKTLTKCREERYLCSPLDIVYNKGKYYLVAANTYQEKNGGHYFVRVDLMSELRITEEKAVSKKDVRFHDTDDLFMYRIRNQYMYTGNVSPVKVRIKKAIFQQLVDWFGDEFSIECTLNAEKIDSEYFDVRAFVNTEAFLFWVLQYGQDVEVLEPEAYRERVRNVVNAMAEKYNKNHTKRESL